MTVLLLLLVGNVGFFTLGVASLAAFRAERSRSERLTAAMLEMNGESRAAKTLVPPELPNPEAELVVPHLLPRQIGMSSR